MPKDWRLVDSTSNIFTLFVQDSSSTTGAGLDAITSTTSGLTCIYKRDKGTGPVTVTLATINTLGTYVSGGLATIYSGVAAGKGLIEFHPPNAAFASNAKSVVFMLQGATNMAPLLFEVALKTVGEPGVDWASITNQTTTVTLSGTSTKAIEPYIAGRTLDADASGRVTTNVLTSTAVAAIWNALTSGMSTAGSIGKKLADWTLGSDNRSLISADAHVSGVTVGWVSASVGSVVAGVTLTGAAETSLTSRVWNALTSGMTTVGSIGKKLADWSLGSDNRVLVSSDAHISGITVGSISQIGTNVLTGQAIAASGISKVVTAVWDETLANHLNTGSTGAQLNAAGSAGDPWTTVIPAAYAKGTAGYLLGTAGATGITGISFSVTATTAVWDALTAAMTRTASIGKKLADWVLGTDSRVLVSADAHTSGVTVSGFTNTSPANLVSITGNATGVSSFDRSTRAIVLGTCAAGGGVTQIVTSTLTPSAAVADQFKGRIVIFDKDTGTAVLRGQATDITTSSIGGVLTVTALTTTPGNGDTFVIL